MKKNLAVGVVIVLLVTLVAAGCSAAGANQPLPTVVLSTQAAGATTPQPAQNSSASSSLGGGVTASGNVTPARQSQIAASLGGRVIEVAVKDGDTVKAGQVLVKFSGAEKLASAVEAANLQLLTAQQAVKALNDNAAKAYADAELRLANAKKAQEDAQRNREWRNFRNGSEAQVNTAQADVILAEDRLTKAQTAYDSVKGNAEDNVVRAGALSALAAAQKARDKALTNLAWLQAEPSPLDLLQAQATLDAAKAETDTAQKQVDSLKNGPDPDELALAQEQVKNAQALLAANQAALADLELKAPFDGSITKLNIHTGEWTTPGQPLLFLVDLGNLRIETTDLSERDVPAVKVGQKVTVLVHALNQTVTGHVVEISALADSLGGDVVYKTTIELDKTPDGLRSGMSVDVRYEQ
jgi:HlyD family secretion protein